jgi:glycerol-3-phosphate dehydrogenase (NAD(P)+)
MKLAIVGGGSWGTALAIVLAPRFKEVRLWIYEQDLAERMAHSRENDVFLPGFSLPPNVTVGNDLSTAVTGSGLVMGVMPSRHARRLWTEVLPHVESAAILVSATKGIERGSLLRMSEVIEDVRNTKSHIAVLSGPTFAREVARQDPTAMVVASTDPETAARVQKLCAGNNFRLYTNADPAGVELGGALKNVIAIGAGICQGLGFGNNSQAALVTRGLAEITRIAVAAGAQPRTMAGLAGLGDLVLTCGGSLSRNRKVGMELADGRTLAEITGSMRMVAEGVETCDAAVELGVKYGVDLPIMRQMHAVLHGKQTPLAALRELMDRSLKSE